MNQTKKRNIIIGALCAVVLLMVVGYAAFATQLNINGTAGISSNWKILITNIETKNIVGGASNAKEPTGIGSLTATFNTNLISPGDSIEYDITVTNQGSLDARLDKITKTESNNPAITFTTSGLTEGTILAVGQSQVLTVKVEYDNSVTSQPESTDATLNITLDYVQNDGTVVPTNNVVYRHTTDRMNIGDSIEGIETVADYTTLGKTYFLKHNVIDGVIESSEVCFVKDGLHCLVGGDSGAAYETNKALLLSVFGESACRVNDSYFACNDDLLEAFTFVNGSVFVGAFSISCNVDNGGSAYCME